MSSVMKAKSTIKSALFATNHSHHYGTKQKVNEVTDFEVILGCNRKFILDFQVIYNVDYYVFLFQTICSQTWQKCV